VQLLLLLPLRRRQWQFKVSILSTAAPKMSMGLEQLLLLRRVINFFPLKQQNIIARNSKSRIL
jgi:hypothetical protein